MLKAKIVLLFVICSLAAMADPISGTLYYTTFAGGTNVHKVDYAYDGGALPTSFVLSGNTGLAATVGADGIIFAPDGNLLVGGQGPSGPFGAVHEITAAGAPVTDSAIASATGAYHLELDPSLTKMYTSNCCGGSGVTEVPLAGGGLSGGANTFHPTSLASGAPVHVTGMAWIGSIAYYTGAGSGGFGDFGTIDTTTWIATPLLTALPAAHGIVFDSFTGDLMLFGDSHITQVSGAGAIVSDFTFGGCAPFDQGAVDGKGHALVASNCGNLTFMDYSASGLVGFAGNYVNTQFLAANLDDVAPLSGLGSNPVPEPASIFLLGSVLAGFVAYRRRRSQTI